MKRIFTVLAVISLLIFVSSCGSDTGDSGNTGNTGDTGDTGNTGNTGDTGDTGNTGDTDVDVVNDDDTGNTGDDTDAGNTGDTAVECTGVSFDNLPLADGYYEGTPSAQIGDSTLEDFISMQFYNTDLSAKTSLTTGTFDLASELNTNYATCTECLLIFEDFDGSAIAKTYFQESGTLTITEVKEGTIESIGTVTAKLIEVTIAEDYTSTPVEGGGCYEIETGAWDNICVPDCEGKICGTDGCGGTCGTECDAEKTCNAEGTACVDFSCTAITTKDVILDTADAENSFWMYAGTFDPNTGDTALDDEFMIQLYTEAAADDSFDLADTNFMDCNQCLLVREDLEYDETSGDLIAIAKTYFQQKGTIAFESFDSATGNVKATLTDVRLIEVMIDGSTYESTPVQGGACLEIATGTIEVQ